MPLSTHADLAGIMSLAERCVKASAAGALEHCLAGWRLATLSSRCDTCRCFADLKLLSKQNAAGTDLEATLRVRLRLAARLR